jgi:hypothetical protein
MVFHAHLVQSASASAARFWSYLFKEKSPLNLFYVSSKTYMIAINKRATTNDNYCQGAYRDVRRRYGIGKELGGTARAKHDMMRRGWKEKE